MLLTKLGRVVYAKIFSVDYYLSLSVQGIWPFFLHGNINDESITQQ